MEQEIEIGRVCEKICGKEKGQICVVINKDKEGFVLIDGNVKRRKCNISHLKPLDNVLKIKQKEDTEKVREAMRKAGIDVIKKVKLKETLRKAREDKRDIEREKQKKDKK